MSPPAVSSAIRVAGQAATAASYDSKPSAAPSIISRWSTAPIIGATSAASAAIAREVTSIFAAQLPTM